MFTIIYVQLGMKLCFPIKSILFICIVKIQMKLPKIVNVYDYSSKGICFYVMIKLNQYIGCKNQCYSKQSMLKSKFNCPLKTRLSLVNLLPNKMWFNYVLWTILLKRIELLCHLFIYFSFFLLPSNVNA